MVVITDEEAEVTTQGESKFEALLMLADALASHEDSDADLLGMALDVFVPDPRDTELLAELADMPYQPPEISQDRVTQQREAALWLAKTHKTTDYSDPDRFDTLRSLLYGGTRGISIDTLRELVDDDHWDVFEAIATGARTVEEIGSELTFDEDHVREAVQKLQEVELIAEADEGSLYAARSVVGVGPYSIGANHVIDWGEQYDHVLVSNLDDGELPERAEEGVFVERRGTSYGWYHDPATYSTEWTDEVVLSRDEAERAGASPCPRCFPDTEYGKTFDVTEFPGGMVRFVKKDHDELGDASGNDQ